MSDPLAVSKQQVYADTMRDLFGASAVAEKRTPSD